MKVNYGIYLGVTSASIAKMEDGLPVILRTNTLKDRMPVCVCINRKRMTQVGDAAYNAHRSEFIKHQNGLESTSTNSFVEFGKTLGTDKSYYSSNANKSFTSTELIAEIIKKLLSFEKNRKVNSTVITIPNGFKINQIDAIIKAGRLAGLEQVEVVQEAIAVGLAYDLDSDNKDGCCLVFDFGRGTFNAALLKVVDGIIQMLDSSGDNFLGGKNLDDEIVDKIIIPHLKENFSLDNLMEDNNKMNILR